MEAGLDLLGTVGWQGATVRAACQRAGLTPRYFYESFADRDELLVAIFDGIMADVTRVVVAARPAGPREFLQATMTGFVQVVTDDPRKGKVAFIEALGSEALMRKRLDTARMFAAALAAQVRAAGGDGGAVETACLIAAGGLIETMIAWLSGELDRTAEQLIDDYTDLCLAAIERAGQVPR